MIASKASIERPLVPLIVDASGQQAQEEPGLAHRVRDVLLRRELPMAGEGLVAAGAPDDLAAVRESLDEASCLIILAEGTAPDAAGRVGRLWDWLATNIPGPKLSIVVTAEAYDDALAKRVLDDPNDLAPIAVAQRSPASSRAAGLFLLKFLTEMQLHSDERMTGRMAWFSWRKANELLKRRNLAGDFDLRA